jgi:hypothetical protein
MGWTRHFPGGIRQRASIVPPQERGGQKRRSSWARPDTLRRRRRRSRASHAPIIVWTATQGRCRRVRPIISCQFATAKMSDAESPSGVSKRVDQRLLTALASCQRQVMTLRGMPVAPMKNRGVKDSAVIPNPAGIKDGTRSYSGTRGCSKAFRPARPVR